jgi:hypothetical protein
MENTENKLNVHKLMEVLSEILSEKYGCKITMRAIPKDQVNEEIEQQVDKSA